MTPYYEDSAVTIFHSDCLPAMLEMEEKSIDMIFTDPPYGLNYNNVKRNQRKEINHVRFL